MAVNTINTTMVAGVKYTVQTDTSADWSSVSNDVYFYDLAEQKVYYKDSNGTIIDAYAPATPTSQAQVLYVDSEFGTDAPTSGDLSSPFLTPEYALTQISNTASITADTNSNTTISGISDVYNNILEVGMYLTGTGIPFGTIIVAKGNEGGDANTITLSKSATATASGLTLTWWKQYRLIANGVFNITSSLNKSGVIYDFKNSTIYYGAINLFRFTVNSVIPEYFYLGKSYGTSPSSAFFNHTVSFQEIELDYGDAYTIGTTQQIGNGTNQPLNCPSFNIYGSNFIADFGTAVRVSPTNKKSKISGYFYGLLGGIYAQSCTMDCRVVTPTSVTALSLSGCIYKGSATGTISLTGCEFTGNMNGTTLTCSSSTINVYGGMSFTNGTYSSSTLNLINGSAQLGSTTCTFSSGSSYIFGTLNFNSLDMTISSGATLENNAYITTSWFSNTINVSGTYINKSLGYTLGHVVGLNINSGGVVINYGDIPITTNLGSGSRLENYGKITSSVNLNSDCIFINKGIFKTTQSPINISNDSAIFENFGILELTTTDINYPVIVKTRGKLKLLPGSVIKVNNGVSPIKIGVVDSGTTTSTTAFELLQSGQNFFTTVVAGNRVHNTTDDTWATVVSVDSNTRLTLDADIMVSGDTYDIYGNPDVYYFNVVSNCDGTTYGLLQSFDGIAPAPNDLVGGTLYENVNY